VFAIALQQQQYKIYILSDLSQSRRWYLKETVSSPWRIQSQELLYLDAERVCQPDLTVRVEFHLFPICGNLSDNTYTYDGQQYTLKHEFCP